MKKIFSIFLLLFFIGGNFSFAATCESINSSHASEKRTESDGTPHFFTCEIPTTSQTCYPGTAQDSCTAAGYQCCINKQPPSTPSTPPPAPILKQVGESCAAPEECQSDNCSAGVCAEPTTTSDILSPGTEVGGSAGGSAGTSAGANNCAGCTAVEVGPCPALEKTCNGIRYCCPDTSATSSSALPEDQTVYGITIGPKCLLNGQCKFNIYDALGIRKSVRNEGDPTSVGIFVQDIVLSATMFIGTIVTIAIIVSGLMRIMAGATGKDPTKAKSGLINSLIGLLIVTSSYLIIRLVQYVAKGF